MKICFVFEGYPTKKDPFEPFVREIVLQLSNLGISCSVIAPQSITRGIKVRNIRPKHWTEKDEKGNIIDIYQPYCFSFSHCFPQISRFFFHNALKNAYKKVRGIDAMYAHFWHMGVQASKIEKNIPLFIACGENKIIVKDVYSEKTIQELKKQLKGVIYVSKKSFDEASKIGLQDNQKYRILPNGFDSTRFHPIPKETCRDELGWNRRDFVLCFVGAFEEHKGPCRVLEAVRMANKATKNNDIKICFVGRGTQKLVGEDIIFCNSVDHDKIPTYLCASDIFILPSTMEGCSNAVIEALGCGLPIIASDRPFNHDILDSSCSILVEPEDVDAISKAILTLYQDRTLLRDMSACSANKSLNYKIENRAKAIYNFITENI